MLQGEICKAVWKILASASQKASSNTQHLQLSEGSSCSTGGFPQQELSGFSSLTEKKGNCELKLSFWSWVSWGNISPPKVLSPWTAVSQFSHPSNAAPYQVSGLECWCSSPWRPKYCNWKKAGSTQRGQCADPWHFTAHRLWESVQ